MNHYNTIDHKIKAKISQYLLDTRKRFGRPSYPLASKARFWKYKFLNTVFKSAHVISFQWNLRILIYKLKLCVIKW